MGVNDVLGVVFGFDNLMLFLDEVCKKVVLDVCCKVVLLIESVGVMLGFVLIINEGYGVVLVIRVFWMDMVEVVVVLIFSGESKLVVNVIVLFVIE